VEGVDRPSGTAPADAELARLVAQARALKAEHLAPDFAWEREQVPDEPLDELVRRVIAEAAEHWKAQGPHVALHRAWARARLAPDAEEAAVDELARRRVFALRLNSVLRSRVRDCAAAPVVGPALELLRTPGKGVITAYVHSGVTCATWYALPPSIGRPVYVAGEVPPPGDAAPRTPSATAYLSLLYHGEQAGMRWVAPQRRLDVLRALLHAGERCSLSLDAPGRGHGTVFGGTAWSSTAAATLARLAGVPLVVVTGYLRAPRFGVQVSAPLYPHEYDSIREGHQRLLEIVEEQLDHDPGQMVTGFPTTERTEHEGRRRRPTLTAQDMRAAGAAFVAARGRHAGSAARVRAEQQRLSELRDGAAPAGEVLDQKERVRAAAAARDQARAELDGARARRDDARIEHRRAVTVAASR
jgi:hypothetical protein